VEDGEGKMIMGGNEQCMECHGTEAQDRGGSCAPIESFLDHLRDIEEHHVIRVEKARKRRSCVYCHDPHLLR
ncbi:MAG: hypothetical protein ACYTFG_11780, partial [Planctomycetota bacterium]|jgi:nitrate reductase cytochrome c-type subunit